uniref:RAP domain-containing protein n=1 Tax=Odontella aurita TaxID=265563 RepID=A0A7S4II93_9STRA
MTFEVWDDYASKDGFGAAYSSASSPLAVEEYAEDEDEDDAEDDDVDRDEWEPSMWNSAEECSLDVVDCLYDAVAAELIRRRSATDRPPRAAELDPAALDPPPAEEEGTSLLRKCKWRDLANVAWAYASRGYAGFSRSSERMMGALSQEVARRLDIDTVGIDEAENGESGSGSGGHRSPPLPRDLSQIAWSLGVLQSDNFRLGEGLVRVTEAIGRNIVKEDGSLDGNFGPSELVQFAVALSHGRVDDDSLLRAVYREALGLLEEKENGPKRPNHHHTRPFRTWELSILLWVQARLYLTEKRGQVHPAFTAAATRTLLGRVRDAGYDANKAGLGSQEQANIAWSLTVLEGYEQTPDETAELLRAVFESSSSTHGSGAPRPIRLEHAHQLWQALFLLETDCPSAVFSDLGGDVDDGGGSAPPPASVVPPRFRSYLSSLWNSEKSRRKTSSARHRAISKTLDLMGVRHRNEHEEDIDVAIVLGGEAEWTGRGSRMGGGFARKSEEEEKSRRRVAVEFDGPSHFTRPAEGMRANPALPPSPPRALGHTVLKYRLLKRQGWTVVRVPYYEFDKIPFWASMERQRYLQRLLKTHADIRFSDVDVSEYKPNIPNRRTRFD